MEKTVTKREEFIKLCESYGVNPDNVPDIISVEEAYKVCGFDRNACMPNMSCFPGRHSGALMSTADLFIVHEAFNKDPETGELYEPNWNDGNENKWTYWWDMEKDKNNPSGFRFYDSYCDRVNANSTGGSRLCNRREDINIFIAKHFTHLFRNVMVFEK